MDSRIHSALITESRRTRRTGRRTHARDGLVMRWVRP
jgi:hypothetical protein